MSEAEVARFPRRLHAAFDRKAEERAHILEGLKIALDHLDERLQLLAQEIESRTRRAWEAVLARDPTRVEAHAAPLDEAQEVLGRSFPELAEDGRYTNVISPVVMPKSRPTP